MPCTNHGGQGKRGQVSGTVTATTWDNESGSLESLVACPQCDALHRVPDRLPHGTTAACKRCGKVLAEPRQDAFLHVLVLAGTAMILMAATVFFPFMQIEAAGLSNRVSVLDAVFAFSSAWMEPLSLAVAATIMVVPMMRFAAVIYTLWPLIGGRRPYRNAMAAFRIAERLRPWAMAEIFMVAVAVAMVKVAGLASIQPGPAFWSLIALVIVTVLHDNFMCRFTVWRALECKTP